MGKEMAPKAATFGAGIQNRTEIKMTTNSQNVNGGGLAKLQNVWRFMTLVEELRGRAPHLPGIGVFHGYSGYGKTFAAIFAQNVTNAAVLEIGDSWTKKTLLQNLLSELGVEPPKRAVISDLAQEAIMALGDDYTRPLIIDEADKLADKGMLELIRELQEHSQVPLLLIGEEQLPAKLQKVERVHNRVLQWVPAEPCDYADAEALAEIYCAGIALSEGLIQTTLQKSEGRARRLAVNFNTMKIKAKNLGRDRLTEEEFHASEYYTGEPPRRMRRAA